MRELSLALTSKGLLRKSTFCLKTQRRPVIVHLNADCFWLRLCHQENRHYKLLDLFSQTPGQVTSSDIRCGHLMDLNSLTMALCVYGNLNLWSKAFHRLWHMPN